MALTKAYIKITNGLTDYFITIIPDYLFLNFKLS
jgi:hypothetical protein